MTKKPTIEDRVKYLEEREEYRSTITLRQAGFMLACLTIAALIGSGIAWLWP